MNAVTERPPLRAEPPASSAGWQASLRLGYARRGARTVLAERAHRGPLVVQRALYPEGEAVCHTILVHPPAGIAGGDQLGVDVNVGEGAHVLLTTPGAGKWYRSAGARSGLGQRIAVGSGAVCEWLPQESIVFDGAIGDLATELRLHADACFIGTEMLCFGRTGSGERFRRGELTTRTRIVRDDRAVWLERGRIEGDGAVLGSPVGLHAQPVSGSFVVASPLADVALLEALRGVEPVAGEGAVTLLPGLLLARWLGPACEPGRQWFSRLWSIARPAVAGRAMQTPRIWNT